MPSIAQFILAQSSLGPGNTVEALLLNPSVTIEDGGLVATPTPPVQTVGSGTVVSSGTLGEAPVSVGGSVEVGAIAPAGTIDPAP